jgi:heme exporter protein A
VSLIAELLVKSLPLVRGGRVLQRDISFSVSAGEILSIRGPNGVGKTSLLRAIAGLLAIPDDCIIFRLHPNGIAAHPEERRANVGWLGHLDGVKRQLSLRENLQFHYRYNRGSGGVREALAAFGLGHLQELPAQYLSYGQRRRLAFARLLVDARWLWLLDEPMSAIDSTGKECIRRHIQEHCGKGGMVVAAVHEPLGVETASLELE